MLSKKHCEFRTCPLNLGLRLRVLSLVRKMLAFVHGGPAQHCCLSRCSRAPPLSLSLFYARERFKRAKAGAHLVADALLVTSPLPAIRLVVFSFENGSVRNFRSQVLCKGSRKSMPSCGNWELSNIRSLRCPELATWQG